MGDAAGDVEDHAARRVGAGTVGGIDLEDDRVAIGDGAASGVDDEVVSGGLAVDGFPGSR